MKMEFIKNLSCLFSTLTLLTCSFANGQSVPTDYPVVGQIIPQFKLDNIQYYSKPTFNPDDAKGRWLVLDFWSKGCVSCVQSFPKLDSLQDKFKSDVQFILIGDNDRSNKNIEKDYERYRKHFNLNLSFAFDSTLFERFGIQSVPYVIIVDPEKKVYSLTSSSEITTERLEALILGNKPIFKKTTNKFSNKILYQKWEPFKIEELTSGLILLKSVLVKNSGEPAEGLPFIDDRVMENQFYQLSGFSLANLYRTAYLPNPATSQPKELQYWQHPILETKDSLHFLPSYSTNLGLYNYGLFIPKGKANAEVIRQIMQKDLTNCFGYNVRLEKRVMPYYRLTVNDKARNGLKVTTQYSNYQESPSGLQASNISIESILLWISLYNGKLKLPLIDETNLGRNIAINLAAVMADIDDVAKALKSEGLILEKSKKEMNVLVISDAEVKNN